MKVLGNYLYTVNGKQGKKSSLTEIATTEKNAEGICLEPGSVFVFDTLEEIGMLLSAVEHVASFELFNRHYTKDGDEVRTEAESAKIAGTQACDWVVSQTDKAAYVEATEDGFSVVFPENGSNWTEQVLKVTL